MGFGSKKLEQPDSDFVLLEDLHWTAVGKGPPDIENERSRSHFDDDGDAVSPCFSNSYGPRPSSQGLPADEPQKVLL